MARQVESVDVIASQRPERSATVRRRLRLGPRSRPVIRRPLRSHVRSRTADINIVENDVDKAVDKGSGLVEWHDMTPGRQQAAWAELRAWVAWLYDRYELGTEDRLPRCWPRHPGLVEELWALRAWRLEVYSGGQPCGQAPRDRHTKLRALGPAARPLGAGRGRNGARGAARRVGRD